MTLLENSVFADVNELNMVELIKVGLNPMTCVLRKRPCEGIEIQRCTKRRTLGEGGDRNWSDGSKTEENQGTSDTHNHQKLGERQGTGSPSESPVLQIL